MCSVKNGFVVLYFCVLFGQSAPTEITSVPQGGISSPFQSNQQKRLKVSESNIRTNKNDVGCQNFVLEGCEWRGNKSIIVSPNTSCVFQCQYKVDDGLIRLNVHELSKHPNASTIFISAQQNQLISSWTLPIIFYVHQQNQQFTSIEETLCPSRNSSIDKLYFRVSSSSTVTLNLSLSNNIRYKLNLNDTVVVVTTPVSPWFKLYEWGDGEESVLVTAESVREKEGKVCALLSLQNAQCPIGMRMEDIVAGRGRYQSFQERGGMVAKRSVFPDGIHIVVLPLPDDFTCTGIEEDIPMISSRKKSIRLQVLPHSTISSNWMAYVGIGMFVILVVSFSTFIVTFNIRRNLKFETCESSEDEESDLLVESVGGGRRVVRSEVGFIFGGLIHRNTPSPPTHAHNSIQESAPNNEEMQDAPPERHGVRERVMEILAHGNENSHGDIVVRNEDNLSLALPHALPSTVVNVTRENNPRYMYWWKVLSEYQNHSVPTNLLSEIGFQRNLVIVAVFMALPFSEILRSYLRVFTYHGSEDQCFFNSRCITSWGIFSDVSRVFTNFGYFFCGCSYLYILKEHKRLTEYISGAQTLGVSRNYGLFTSLGVGLLIQAFMSGLYHMCPNPVTLRFDMMFMYVNAVVMVVGVWGLRHGSVSHHVYPSVALIGVCLLAAESREWISPLWFWLIVGFFQVVLTLTISAMLCKLGTWSFSPSSMLSIWKDWQPILQNLESIFQEDNIKSSMPWTIPRWIIGILVNFIIIGAGAGMDMEPYVYILLTCISNMGLYIINYIFTKKLLCKEKGTAISWVCFVVSLCLWIIAIVFFSHHNTNSEGTPSSSHALNAQCLFLVLDAHDMWHLFSAFAMYFTFVSILTLDDDLARRNPLKIAVF